MWLLNKLYPVDKQQLNPSLSTVIYDVNNELLRIKLSADGYYRIKAITKDLPQLLKNSVLHFEDKYFYYHFGINPIAIIKAIIHNVFNQRIIGASTITMQVTRLMHPKKRTAKNKIIEMFRAIQLEWHYSKDEILAFYFNLAPYGGNIEGVKTAAWFYYKKSLNNLSTAEIATLTAIPKNPRVNRPDRSTKTYQNRLRVLRILLKQKLITRDSFERAYKETINKKRYKAPFIAPHFTNSFKQAGIIYSSLDLNIQKQLHKILKTHVDRFVSFGLHNAAGLVIHNPTMTVRAYVGSDRFFNKKNEGQNNGVKMIRTPGSTLKPFIYAKALEHGFITPQMQLFDLPLHLNGYDPKNYSRMYSGTVTAETALQNSLNVPAVELNELLKNDSLYELLKQAKVQSLQKPKHYYGASIALGGFGISLYDIAHLYSAFAHGGMLKTLGHSQNHSSKNITQLLSNSAAFITMEMLKDSIRPEFSSYWESSSNAYKLAFKTGTSANAKDLYSISVNPQYTVAIWMGNFSGKATKNLTGMGTSSRAIFEMNDFLNQYKQPYSWFKQPKAVTKKTVCTDAIQNNKCTTLQTDYVINGVAINRPCRLLRAEVLSYLYESKQFKNDDVLAHKCFSNWQTFPPLIASLYNNQVIEKTADEASKQSIALSCYSFKQDSEITWFIDDQQPIKTVSAKTNTITLQAGAHRLTCIDSASLASSVNITLSQ